MSYGLVVGSIVSGGAAVGFVGMIISRVSCNLGDRRQAETLKLSKQKELIDFLVDWKEEIMTDDAPNLPSVYHRELPHVQIKAAAIRSHLGEMQRAKFNELIGNLSRLTTPQIIRPQRKSPQELICQPLDELIGFMRDLSYRR
jgi:hypothetical protein